MRLLLTSAAQVGSACYCDAVFDAVLHLKPHSRALAGRWVERHHVAQVDRGVLLNPAALRVALRRADVLPHAVNSFDDHAVLVGQDPQDLAYLALVRARDHDDLVTTLNMPCHGSTFLRLLGSGQTTSAASDTIFIKFLSRNSRATAPKMRVPRGLFSLSITTAALRSNRT